MTTSRPRARFAMWSASGSTSSGRSRSGGTVTTVSIRPANAVGIVVEAFGGHGERHARSRDWSARPDPGVARPPTTAAGRRRARSPRCAPCPARASTAPARSGCPSGRARSPTGCGRADRCAAPPAPAASTGPTPGSPTAATIVPSAIARSARPTAEFQASDSACSVPEPGSSAGHLDAEHLPAGRLARTCVPLDLASISAAVLLAADRASASSRSLEDCDQVVRLTQPSSRPVVGVEHRHGRAGERAQAQRIVLVGADQRRHPVGERKAEAVGADVALGVGEARRQVHVVERLQAGRGRR